MFFEPELLQGLHDKEMKLWNAVIAKLDELQKDLDQTKTNLEMVAQEVGKLLES